MTWPSRGTATTAAGPGRRNPEPSLSVDLEGSWTTRICASGMAWTLQWVRTLKSDLSPSPSRRWAAVWMVARPRRGHSEALGPEGMGENAMSGQTEETDTREESWASDSGAISGREEPRVQRMRQRSHPTAEASEPGLGASLTEWMMRGSRRALMEGTAPSTSVGASGSPEYRMASLSAPRARARRSLSMSVSELGGDWAAGSVEACWKWRHTRARGARIPAMISARSVLGGGGSVGTYAISDRTTRAGVNVADLVALSGAPDDMRSTLWGSVAESTMSAWAVWCIGGASGA